MVWKMWMGCAVVITHSMLIWPLYCSSPWASNGAVIELMIIIDLMFLNLCINPAIFLIIEQYIFPTAYDFKRFNSHNIC